MGVTLWVYTIKLRKRKKQGPGGPENTTSSRDNRNGCGVFCVGACTVHQGLIICWVWSIVFSVPEKMWESRRLLGLCDIGWNFLESRGSGSTELCFVSLETCSVGFDGLIYTGRDVQLQWQSYLSRYSALQVGLVDICPRSYFTRNPVSPISPAQNEGTYE